jgi:hypothetical protein
MNDPFDVLRDELVAAERRLGGAGAVRARSLASGERLTGAGRSPARRFAPWLRRRPLVLAAALVVASGSAAAGVVSLTSEDSAPLSGTVPAPSPSATSLTYRIEIVPDLRAGAIGWCSGVALRSHGRPLGAGSGCGPAPPSDAAQIAGGGMTVGRDRILMFTVVDPRVAAIRLHDGRTIAPLANPRLPFGWKAAVAFATRAHGHVEPTDLDWTLQDASGAEMSNAPNERAGTKAAGTRPLPTRTVDPNDPPQVRYAIRARPLPGLRAVSAQIARGTPTHTPDVNGRAFLTRATTVYYLHKRRYRAAILVDARDPKRPAAELPGSTKRADGLVDASGHITARRVGPAWLVIEGAYPRERVAVLQALRVSL